MKLLLAGRKKVLLGERTGERSWLYLPLKGIAEVLAAGMVRLSNKAVQKNLVGL